MTDQSVEVRVGQVWVDNDYRSAGRKIKVARIEDTHAVQESETHARWQSGG